MGGGAGVGVVLMGYPHIKDCLLCDCWPGEGRRGSAELKGASHLGGERNTLPRYFIYLFLIFFFLLRCFNRRAVLVLGLVFLILILVTLALSHRALFMGLHGHD